ncbi:thiolase family protein [Actinomadura bangladeshensis]|uniref:Thiolase family protein n=1 Tax=Actinomadura bangladeshensis TaxID=453573 RepID=A0A4R4PET1_9ACTN|nr:thiolase family protein [Actinomadura bangladeshensis]TDC20363.1 thiolase family protein [Actinomadura bangladeshensis]
MSTTRRAAVVGVYTTEQGRRLGRTKVSLEIEAIKGALADAGLAHTDIDGLSPLLAEPWSKTHMYWAEQLGERPITYIGTGQGEGAVAKAAAAISAGTCNVALAWVAHAGGGNSPGSKAVPTAAPRLPDFHWEIQGAYMTPLYALWARRYMHEFGASSEDLAQVAVIHRDHAVHNPDSVMGRKGPITVEDVVGSRMIADPLHLLDCSIENDGGYALVLAAEDIAKDCRNTPVWVLGGAEATATDVYQTFNDPWFPEEGRSVRRCTDMAFDIAGVSRSEIDVANLYDCFTITMLRNLEEMGFCKIGEGADYVREGRTKLGGAMPCNTDGGLLSNSHNGNPSGMSVIEVVRQLRGECGERQVPNARIGVALGQGGSVHGLASTVVLAHD